MSEANRLALNFELPAADTAWWELIPAGSFTGRDGRTWVNDNPEGILSAFNTYNADIPLDEEHATELKGPQGDPAPARGFFKDLEIRSGAIWGKVELNSAGSARIDDKEYRYYSPAFMHNQASVVTSLSSVGLTNKHNLDLPALNNQQTTEDSVMDEKDKIALCAALGLAATVNAATIIAAVDTLKSDKQLALNRAETPDAAKYVLMETYDLALNRAATAEAKVEADLKTRAEDLVGGAIKSDKFPPSTREHYLSLCRTEEGYQTIKVLVEKAPKVISDEQNLKDKVPKDEAGKLNAEELAVCHALGQTEEEYLAAKQLDAAVAY